MIISCDIIKLFKILKEFEDDLNKEARKESTIDIKYRDKLYNKKSIRLPYKKPYWFRTRSNPSLR